MADIINNAHETKICPACGIIVKTLVKHAIECHNGLEGIAKELGIKEKDLWKVNRNQRLYKRDFEKDD